MSALKLKVEHSFTSMVDAAKLELAVQLKQKAGASEVEEVRENKADVSQVEALRMHLGKLNTRMRYLEEEHERA